MCYFFKMTKGTINENNNHRCTCTYNRDGKQVKQIGSIIRQNMQIQGLEQNIIYSSSIEQVGRNHSGYKVLNNTLMAN